MRSLFLAFSLILFSQLAIGENTNAQTTPNHNIDSLQRLLKAAQNDTNKVNILYALAVDKIKLNPDEALNDGKSSLDLAQKINWRKGCFLAYSVVGSAYLSLSNYASALQNTKKAIEFSDAENDRQLVVNNLIQAGNANLYLSDYNQALDYDNKALNMSREIGNKKLEALNLNSIGRVYLEISNFPKALDLVQQALKIDKEIGAKNNEARDYGVIGSIYDALNNYPKALEYYNLALKQNKESGNKLGETAYLNNIGLVYNALNDHQKALQNYHEALEISRAIGNKDFEARNLSNIGNVYAIIDLPKAMGYYNQALEIEKSIGDKNGAAITLCNIGKVYSDLKKYSTAIDFEEQSLKIAKEINSLEIQKQVYIYLYHIYDSIRLPAKAYANYKQFILIRDSMINADKQNEITRKQMQFDFDLKEATAKAEQDKKDVVTKAEIQKDKLQRDGFIGGGIFLLLLSGILFYGYQRNKKQNHLLASQKAAIEVRDKEKELLLRELHHRVKNNLQIVSSLLSLQSNQIQDDTSRQAFREGQSRVEAMALIHQGLYLGDKLSTIDMNDYLKNLVRSIAGSYGYNSDKYKLNFDVEKIDLDVEIAIPLGLIMNEILSNCFKHAFKDVVEPRLDIILQKNHDKIALTIADNGIGIPAEFNKGKAKTFGMRMVNSLTKQIRGSLEILNKGGSVFEFHFPLDKNVIEAING